MTNRLCKLCGEWKPLSTEFFYHFKYRSKSGGVCEGFYYTCKQCKSARQIKKLQELKENPEEYEKFCKKETRRKKDWGNTKGGRETRRRYLNRPHVRIAENLRSRIRIALKQANGTKSARTLELLGCDIEFLRQHLSNQFTEGMTWDNYGEWHVDHIKPCSAFDLTDPEQQLQCFHYTNLQPLWAIDNLSKSDKWEGKEQLVVAVWSDKGRSNNKHNT